MKINFLFLLLITLFTTRGFSQEPTSKPGRSNPEMAYAALKVYDYFKAKQLFLESFPKYAAIGSYGLSDIYSRNDNPFYHLDSAYFRVLAAQELYVTRSGKEEKLLKKLSIDSLTIINQKEKIEGLAFNKAIKSDKLDSINHFINVYNLSQLIPLAVQKRDSIAFKIAVGKNSSSVLKNYIAEYPQSRYQQEARQKYEKLLFTEETKEGTAESYAKFSANHPQSPFKEQSDLKLYKLQTDNKQDLNSYYSFITTYPTNVFVDEAWQKVYSIYRSEKPKSTIPDFLHDFPDFTYKERLLEEYRLEAIDYLPYKQGELWGFINANGEIVVEAKYDFVEDFSEGIAIVSKNGKLGYITKTGEELVPPFYDEAENFHNNLAIVGEKGKYGVIDRNGKMLVALSFAEISDFSEGLAVAFDGKFFGYINRNGSTVIPFRFDESGDFKDGTATCMIDDMYGIIDATGNEIIPFYYEAIANFSNGLAKVKKDDYFGMINKEGAVILPVMYDEIGEFNDNRALVSQNGKHGYIDTTCRIVIPLTYKTVIESQEKSAFKNGMAVVKSGLKYCIIDTAGKKIIAPLYDDIGNISYNIVVVKKSNKWGYLSLSTGKNFIKNSYQKALPFSDGHAIVVLNGKMGVIDSQGKLLIPFENESLIDAGNNFFVSVRAGKTGMIDINNFEIVPFEYEQNSIIKSKFVRLTSPSAILWFDLKNKKVCWKG